VAADALTAPGRRAAPVQSADVRLTLFRSLMEAQFGPHRAPSVAQDHVFSALGGRTVNQALAAGLPPRAV